MWLLSSCFCFYIICWCSTEIHQRPDIFDYLLSSTALLESCVGINKDGRQPLMVKWTVNPSSSLCDERGRGDICSRLGPNSGLTKVKHKEAVMHAGSIFIIQNRCSLAQTITLKYASLISIWNGLTFITCKQIIPLFAATSLTCVLTCFTGQQERVPLQTLRPPLPLQSNPNQEHGGRCSTLGKKRK